MRRMPWAVYLWPGLPQLSSRGNWSALMLAVGAAALLNVALLGSFVWTELIVSEWRIFWWIAVATIWGVSAGLSAWWARVQADREDQDSRHDTFAEALDHYLKGNWFETERVLTHLLRKNKRDLEARLMLATLLRHTKRWDEAIRQLGVLVRLEGSQKWDVEIRRERELLTRARMPQEELADEGETEAGPDEPPAEMAHAA